MKNLSEMEPSLICLESSFKLHFFIVGAESGIKKTANLHVDEEVSISVYKHT